MCISRPSLPRSELMKVSAPRRMHQTTRMRTLLLTRQRTAQQQPATATDYSDAAGGDDAIPDNRDEDEDSPKLESCSKRTNPESDDEDDDNEEAQAPQAGRAVRVQDPERDIGLAK